MIYFFQTADDECREIDLVEMTWARVSRLNTTPSITAAENDFIRHIPLESGPLIPMGGGTYNLDGRLPLPEKPTPQELAAPGAGLSSVGILCVLYEDTLMVVLNANAQIKDSSFKSNAIKKVKYKLAQQMMQADKPEEETQVVLET